MTFLFSDIEGSTKLWEAAPDQMRNALDRYDALLRASFEHTGYVFKTIGDAFCVAFAKVPEALEATLAAQLALNAEPWPPGLRIRARMALHTGAVESREGDYFGPPVNRVARLLSVAHGGQSILTQTAYNLARDTLPPGIGMLDLGLHQLKDLARPEQVFQISCPDLPSEFPPLRSLSNQPNNLPEQVNNFIGREKESAEIIALLLKSRLVTLTGPGGTGKTRLALQVAANTLDNYPDGAWLAELAPLSDQAHVARTIADALGLLEQSGVSTLDVLLEILKPKRLLIVLDNCEHLLVACASLVSEVMRRCPGVQILASSREVLGVAGEQAYIVPSLSLPDATKPQTPESLTHFEAVRLFIDRALLSRADFQVTNQNAPAVASLCIHLDGIPLAIELAAARLRSLSVEELDKKLDQRFRLLTGGSRTVLPRQQTLRALIDWSYDLLNDAEKAMLQRVSIFAGGWTLEAAEAICVDELIPDWEVLDFLTSLSDKSLVSLDHRDQQTRYGLLETVRQYALDRLEESGNLTEYRRRQLKFMRESAHKYDPQLKGTNQKVAMQWFDREQGNMRAALNFAMQEKSEDGLLLVSALWYYWYLKPHVIEGQAWAEAFVGIMRDSHTPYARATVLQAAGVMRFCLSDYQGYRDLFLQALDIAESIQDDRLLGAIYRGLGVSASYLEDVEAALTYYRTAVEYTLKSGARGYELASTCANMAYLAEGDESEKFFAIAKEIYGEMGDQLGIALLLGNRGAAAFLASDYDLAKKLHKEALEIRASVDARAFIAGSIEGIAGAIIACNPEPERAILCVKIMGAADLVRTETAFRNTLDDFEAYEKTVATARSLLGEAAYTHALTCGQNMPLTEAITLALEL